MPRKIKDGDVRPEKLLNTRTMAEVFSYRVRANGKWCWPIEDKAFVYFETKEARDAEMAAVKGKLSQKEPTA